MTVGTLLQSNKVPKRRESDLIDYDDESEHEEVEEVNEIDAILPISNAAQRKANTAKKNHTKGQESLVSFMGDKILSPERKSNLFIFNS
jgi:signal transduction histidine kinase